MDTVARVGPVRVKLARNGYGGCRGCFFWDGLNIHTFNLESRRLYKAGGFNHRTDRRVKGFVVEVWEVGWV
jgi:hypothetical protein